MKRARRGELLRMRKRKPASEAGFFVVADRVGAERWRGGRQWGENRKRDKRRQLDFMERDLWERGGRAG